MTFDNYTWAHPKRPAVSVDGEPVKRNTSSRGGQRMCKKCLRMFAGPTKYHDAKCTGYQKPERVKQP
jgi:hypothetical protein